MSIRMASRVALPLILSLVSGLAGAACVPVVGIVRLTPDAACTIRSAAQPGTPAASFTGDCFNVHLALAGFPVATGHAGVTMEPLVSLVPGGGATVTPAMIPVSSAVPAPRQIIQTARTAVTLGQGARRTTLYTTDVIVIQPAASGVIPKAVTEQIVISGTSQEGAYANVTGNLTVLGNSIGLPASVVGQICMP